MITFDCPECGNSMSVEDQFAGKSGKCKTCHAPVRVPESIIANTGFELDDVEKRKIIQTKLKKEKNEPTSRYSLRYILSGVGIFVLIAIAASQWGKSKGGQEGLSSTPGPSTISRELVAAKAWAIHSVYSQNSIKADEAMLGKWLIVTGKVKTIGKNNIGQAYVAIECGAELYSVQCFFSDDVEIKNISSLKPDDSVSIAGVCEGKRVNVIFSSCIVVANTEIEGTRMVQVPK